MQQPNPAPRASANERNPWLVLFAVSLGLFMVIIDVSILSIALPTIAGTFHASLSEVEWTLIAYTLMLSGLVPFFGRISDVIGRKRLFVTGTLVFGAASLFASFSQTVLWLIGARLIQAFGGALITANALAIITDTFPAGKRGTAMGVQAILMSGGAALGPTLGGFLVTRLGWQAIFLVNVPIGVIAAAVGWRILPPLQSHRTLEPIDWPGTGLLMAGLGPLLLGITKSPEWGWGSPATIGLIVVGLVAGAGFVWRELHTAHPLVDLSLFTIRQFVTNQGAGVLTTVAMATAFLLLPFYFQGIRGYSAERTGIVMMPLPLTLMVAAPLSGYLSDRLGMRWIAAVGALILAVGLYLLSGITATMPLGHVLVRLSVLGAGLGGFMAPNNNLVMSAAPAQRRGIASGLLGMFRYIGQSLGVAFSGTAFGLFASFGAFSLSGLPSPQQLAAAAGNPQAIRDLGQAFINGMHAAALLAIPFALVALVLTLLSGRQLEFDIDEGVEPRPSSAGEELSVASPGRS